MKKNFFVLIIMIGLLMFSGLSLVVAAKPASYKIGKQYLVLIAVNQYKHWAALKGPVKDAKQIRRILESRYYIDSVFHLYDNRATKKEIIELFKKLQKQLKKDDSLLIFYAGHGDLDKASGTGYWVPVDGGLDKDVKERWIPYSTLRGIIGKMQAKHILLISDSCYSGDLLEINRAASPEINPPYFQKAYALRCRQVITSGSSETVRDSSEFAKRLKLVLESNTNAILDSLILYDGIRRGMRGTLPLRGELKDAGHETGASFLLFLKDAEKKVLSASKSEIPASEPQAKTTPPGIDLSDIKEKAQEGKLDKAKERGGWSDWLQRFQKDFKKVKEVDFDTEVPRHAKKEAWERLLTAYSKEHPLSEEDDQLKRYAEERLVYWEEFDKVESISISKEPTVRLRSQYKKMSKKDVKAMLFQYNFFSSCFSGVYKDCCNPEGSFNNHFVAGKKVVVDLTTGLMWDRMGSMYTMKYEKARDWIGELNRNKYAGYSDWRLPTLEEGASLLRKKASDSWRHLDEMFSTEQGWIWTGDPYIPMSVGLPAVWRVDFFIGVVQKAFWYGGNYVRAVRSAR